MGGGAGDGGRLRAGLPGFTIPTFPGVPAFNPASLPSLPTFPGFPDIPSWMVAILVAGILPFATLSDKLSSSIAREYPGVVSVYRQTRPYHISGGYGLFSHITGVVQRPE